MRPTLYLAALVLITPPLSASAVERLEIFPAERVLHAPNHTQQLAVIAHFSDGTQRDVTHLTQFTSTHGETASVSRTGRVRFHQSGDVAILCRYTIMASARLTFVEEKPGFDWPKPEEKNLIDHLVFAKLKQMRIVPADLCTDEVFVRRAYLDACGILPTPAEIRRFLNDPRADKRSRLIDELLDRPEYADLWAHYWREMLALPFRNHSVKKTNAYLHWMRGHLNQDGRIDRLAHAIVAGKGVVTDEGPVSFYTAAESPPELAARVSTAFLGMRLECAHCHHHFNTRWTMADHHHFNAFFAQIYRQRLTIDKKTVEMTLIDSSREWVPRDSQKPVKPRFPDGSIPDLKPGLDRRVVLADWLTSPKNPYFARTMVNRIWFHLFGQGIGSSPDSLHELPLIIHEPVLDALAKELVAQRYDAKAIIRIIMNSRTYQLGSDRNAFNKDETSYFSRSYTPRLPSEVMTDIVAQVLELPETYEGMPRGTRAVQSAKEVFQWISFSRPMRISACEAGDAERSIPHILHLLGTSELQAKLENPRNRLGRLLAEKRTDREIMDEVFLAALSRMPREKEEQQVLKHVSNAKDRRRAWEDVLFAVINMPEFARRP